MLVTGAVCFRNVRSSSPGAGIPQPDRLVLPASGEISDRKGLTATQWTLPEHPSEGLKSLTRTSGFDALTEPTRTSGNHFCPVGRRIATDVICAPGTFNCTDFRSAVAASHNRTRPINTSGEDDLPVRAESNATYKGPDVLSSTWSSVPLAASPNPHRAVPAGRGDSPVRPG